MGTTVCVICARSGSKGVPDKNVRPVLGKPLIAHSVEVAVSSNLFDHIVVTSDSQDYLYIAQSYGADMLVLRPSTLAGDGVTKLGAIEHAVSEVETRTGLKVTTIVDLDVTSPLRTASDIQGALELYHAENVTSVITGCASHRSPYTNLVERDSTGVVSVSKSSGKTLSRRQESPECFDMNASIYVWNRDSFYKDPKVFYEDTLLYEMPFERSWDVDNEIDIEIVEFLMSRDKKS